LRQVLQLSSGFRLGNDAAIAVGGAPSSARKVLRLAQAFDDLPGQIPVKVGVAKVGARFKGSLEAGFTAQLRLSIGLPGRAYLHVRAAGGGRPCPPGYLKPSLR
jgi:hypothetical protein